jgi:hypothetical protein
MFGLFLIPIFWLLRLVGIEIPEGTDNPENSEDWNDIVM